MKKVFLIYLKIITVIILCIGQSPNLVYSQIHPEWYDNICEDLDLEFRGVAESTLCEEIGNLEYDIIVGNGSSITHSSQLGTSFTGNMEIVGDFFIDSDFTFKDANVKIAQSAQIRILPTLVISGPIFTNNKVVILDNSRFFSCNNLLWKGFSVSSKNHLISKNNTIIEDAIWAIRMNDSPKSYLTVEDTKFNRNGVGIFLSDDLSTTGGPVLAKLTNSEFTCDAPLNGTQNTITAAGIISINVPLTFNNKKSGLFNYFDNIENGIICQGEGNLFNGNYLNFKDIRVFGIHMENGSTILSNSQFYNVEHSCVKIDFSILTDIRNNSIRYNKDIPELGWPNYRNGILIEKFGINSRTNIKTNIYADFEGENESNIRGIHLLGDNVGSGTKIDIFECNIGYSVVSPSRGIHINGAFPSTSSINIFNNNIQVSFSLGSSTAYGIQADGTMNNLSIYGNNFSNYKNSGIVHSINVRSSSGINNAIEDNTFNSGGFFYSSSNFQNAKICGNTLTGLSAGNGFWFWNNEFGTEIGNNTFNVVGGPIKIWTSATIGPQDNTANEWYPAIIGPFIFRSSSHLECTDCTTAEAISNRFRVNQPQSIFQNSSYDLFSEYHPENVFPDINNELMLFVPNSSLNECGISQIIMPESESLEQLIAGGAFNTAEFNLSKTIAANQYLFKKISNSNQLTALYSNFHENHKNSSIGKLNQVNSQIESAINADQIDLSNSIIFLNNISNLLSELSTLDELLSEFIIYSDNSVYQRKQELLATINNYNTQYLTYQLTYLDNIFAKLTETIEINSSLTPENELISAEQLINDLYLNKKINPGMGFNDLSLEWLLNIANQSSSEVGILNQRAKSLLPRCLQNSLEVNEHEPEPTEVLQTEAEEEILLNGTSINSTTVYPNPSLSNESINIVVPSIKNNGSLTLTDINGTIVYSVRTLANELTKLTLNLSFGFYFLNISLDNGEFHQEKIIVH